MGLKAFLLFPVYVKKAFKWYYLHCSLNQCFILIYIYINALIESKCKKKMNSEYMKCASELVIYLLAITG